MTAVGSGVVVVLPDHWTSVPLRDLAGRERAVRAVVRRRLGVADGRAHLRRELTRDLTASARRAADAGAWLLALYALPVPQPTGASRDDRRADRSGDHPLAVVTASLTASVLPLPGGGRGLDAVAAAVGGAARTAAGAGDRTLVRGTGSLGPVLRRRRVLDRPDGSQHVVWDAWLDVPASRGGAAVHHLAVASEHVELLEPLTGLVDAVVGAVHLLHDRDRPAA
ncbi:hypothetical protein [Cellulomonas marina]|uniref:Uncharacterized protein n=1 Tax=Cellulomonas marina TaxID=988821 RepID=A0A1I0XXJ0_9CELL|nr:hypothetical protein [Cellulomonas marina]GIG28472.1 hypothetical protein Cma02nite_10720 [Cellulomonas marina]SFB05721.1 hypothetical protein SAMN05421867_10648 [Cellulomonas marina]